jgi:hypothetical protein
VERIVYLLRKKKFRNEVYLDDLIEEIQKKEGNNNKYLEKYQIQLL